MVIEEIREEKAQSKDVAASICGLTEGSNLKRGVESCDMEINQLTQKRSKMEETREKKKKKSG